MSVTLGTHVRRGFKWGFFLVPVFRQPPFSVLFKLAGLLRAVLGTCTFVEIFFFSICIGSAEDGVGRETVTIN